MKCVKRGNAGEIEETCGGGMRERILLQERRQHFMRCAGFNLRK